MSVILKHGVARTEQEISAFEQSLNTKLPRDYLQFLSHNDGARPDSNFFVFVDEMRCSVNRFIPISDIQEETSYIENLPTTRIPIALAEGGNYVCLGTDAAGGVFFWDHEEPHLDHRIAESFSRFLESLQAADLSSCVADDAGVRHAWIDPAFLESIKKD